MKYFFGIFLCLISTITLAGNEQTNNGGDRVNNGGDPVALEFIASYNRAWKFVQQSASPQFKELKGIDLAKVLSKLKVLTVDEMLVTRMGESTQESAVVNYPANQLILINRARWMALKNEKIKAALALHEILGLINKEATGDYQYSSAYIAAVGLPGENIAPTYPFVSESQEYNVGSNTYQIKALARFLESRDFFNSVEINYQVFRNGTLLTTENKNGSRMLACTYSEDNNPKALPHNFIRIVQDRNIARGFSLEALGICGNTTSFRVQVIQPNSNSYQTVEFYSKQAPVFREQAAGTDVWFLKQVWGNCGTAGSFYVPQRVLVRDGGSIQTQKLPNSLEEIPDFAPFDWRARTYPALYVSGIWNLDADSVDLSRNFLQADADSQATYEWCGLPTSKEAVHSDANAIRMLGPRPQIFQGPLN